MKRRRYRVTLRQSAVDDLDGIYTFIAVDQPSRAKSFLRALQKKILSLNDFPLRGALCRLDSSVSDSQVRYVVHEGYLIFYEVAAKEVVVLHIVGPGKNWLELFLK